MAKDGQTAHDLGDLTPQTEYVKLNGRVLVGYRAGSKLPAKSRRRRDAAYLRIVHAQRRATLLEAELQATQSEARAEEIGVELEELSDLVLDAEAGFIRAIVPGLDQTEAEMLVGDEELHQKVRALLGYNNRADASADEAESPKEEPQPTERSRRTESSPNPEPTTGSTTGDSPDSPEAE